MQVLWVPAAAVVAAIALAATACGAGGEASPHRSAGAEPRATQTAAAPDAMASASSEIFAAPEAGSRGLAPPWIDRPPTGTASEIALRFLRALQRHDERGAVAELSLIGRSYFVIHSDAVHRVMQDVVAHAQLQAAGRCTRADRLSPDAVVVRCGARNVVVHVLDDPLAPGVELAPWHVRHDVFRGPHTHAFTTVLL